MMHLLATIVCLTNLGFTVAFDTETLNPSWVSYDLDSSKVVRRERRSNDFTADPRVAGTDLTDDYRSSGYDRGHMAPAADFNWNTNALRETYYFTNITPQRPEVNRHEWRDIEREVRQLAASGTVHVLMFPSAYTSNRIGRILVPSQFTKVAYGYFGVRMWQVSNETKWEGLTR